MNDDDDLNDLDLHAWQAPPVPNRLADAVIARVTATDEAIAVALRGRRRRTRLAAAIGCSGAIAAGLAVWLAARPSSPANAIDMTVIAAVPQHVALGPSSADLGPGATIQTERRGGTLRVVQSGTATWHVGANDKLEIDAGSNGTLTAAAGASLRVEATMNTQQALLVGGGVLSAAAIALVTATVYEGRADEPKGVVEYRGTTIRPGTFITIGDAIETARRDVVTMKLGIELAEPLAVEAGGDIAIRPGTSATIWIAQAGTSVPPEARVEVQAACELRVELDGERGVPVRVANSSRGVIVLDVSVGKYDYAATCTGRPTVHGTLDVRADVCRRAACGAEAERMLTITSPALGAAFGAPLVHVTGTMIDPETTTLSVGADIVKPAPTGYFSIDLALTGGESIALRVDHPRLGTQFFVQHSVPAGAATVKKPAKECNEMTCQADGYTGACCSKLTKPGPKCDAQKLVHAGTAANEQGDYAEALKQYAAAYACKPEAHTLELTFMVACNGANVKAARIWWKKLSTIEQSRFAMMCGRMGITHDQLDAR